MEYLDFEIGIEPGSGREYPVLARSQAGGARGTLRFPFDALELESRLKDVEIALLRSSGTGDNRRKVLGLEEQAVRAFGSTLFDALMSEGVRDSYAATRSLAFTQGKGLRLKLRIQPPELAALPWEFLFDPQRQEYLCLSQRTPLVRYLEVPQPIRTLTVAPPLRVLGLVASPGDLEPLDAARERARLERALQRLRGLVEVTWIAGQTWRDLQQALFRGPWHVFHFVGHGGYDPQTDEGLIALVDEAGQSHRLRATLLARLLGEHDPLRLVLLNSCDGARAGKVDIFSSTAATLLQRGLPAVLAMQYEISDRAAIEFAQTFYEAVAHGRPVDTAVAAARAAVSIALDPTVEWGTPVLYTRAPDGVLFRVEGPMPGTDPGSTVASEERGRGRVGADKRFEEWGKLLGVASEEPSTVSVGEQGEPRVAERPEPDDRLARQYLRALAAYYAERWQQAAELLAAIVAERPGYEDAASKLAEARRHVELADLYAEARRLHAAGEWEATIAVFARIHALDPSYDPHGLLPSARERHQAERLEARVDALLAEAIGLMRSEAWEPAASRLEELRGLRVGHPDAEALLTRARRELARRDAARGQLLHLFRQRAAHGYYEDAGRYAQAREWHHAVGCLEELERLLPGYGNAGEQLARARSELQLGEPGTASETQRTSPTAASAAGPITLRTVGRVRALGTLQGHTNHVYGVAFAPDSRLLASGSLDGTVRLWRVADGQLLRILEGHTSHVCSVAFAPDGRMLASGSLDGTVRLWRVLDGQLLRVLEGHDGGVICVAFAPNGQVLASGSLDQTVRLWRPPNGKLVRALKGHQKQINAIAFAPDGQVLVSGSGGWLVDEAPLRLWRVSDGKLLRTLKGHTEAVLSVAFAPDGQVLASSSGDQSVHLWRVADGQLLHTLKGHQKQVNAIAFAPDGQVLVSGSGGWLADETPLRLWRVSDGAALRTLKGHTSSVRSVVFAPDGQVLASGSDDQTIRLWGVKR